MGQTPPMNETPRELSEAGQRVLAAFEAIYEGTFKGDPAANANLEIEVIPVGVLDTPLGEQEAFIAVTPWTMNGLLLPGDGLPYSVDIAGANREVYALVMNEVGPVAQVNIVPDVSKYTSHTQAMTIAESFIPVWRGALEAIFKIG